MGMGSGKDAICCGDTFQPGPMALIADKIVEERYKFSVVDTCCCGFVSEHRLVERSSALRPRKHLPRLPGKKKPKETGYFYRNARALASYAREKQQELGENAKVVAILFRDSDGTASDKRGLWEDKRNSMLHGFEDEAFNSGVPMLPKPKSEAWILCALKENPYCGCDALEERSGNDNSPASLKDELRTRCEGKLPSREELCDMVRQGKIDYRRVRMPSFAAFRDRLNDVL